LGVRFLRLASPPMPTSNIYPKDYKPPRTVAVLGGGLTGLSTAWHLSRWLPKTKITLYEAGDRLGGWIDTETVPVTTPDGKEGTVSFERGARMVQIYRKDTPKFDDMVLYEMVQRSFPRLLCCSGSGWDANTEGT
jgi:pyruvate/2-oxoglutarate dehydrogenase complex dihydrolipoamide dehydrogenase (E3) component